MSGFQAPITIDSAMKYIANNNYLLPAFQREFVWESEQIEKLFDSLMRGYPTSSMLFWKVKGEAKTKWKYYRFLDKFILGATNKPNSNELFNTTSVNDFYAILDGQQRLTAIRLGIYGSYAYHEPRKKWTYSEESFPTRHLYLNLTKQGGLDDDCEYFFKFKKDSETNLKDFVFENNEKWFRVGKIIDFHNSHEETSDYFSDIELTKNERKVIKKLDDTIFGSSVINYYEEEDSNPDRAVKIFTRINSGGTFLSFSDIVFSLMVANWDTIDAKTEITSLFNDIGQKGFTIDKKYIVKAILYLYHKSVKTEINSFDKKFCKKIEENWVNIKSAIISLFDLFRSYSLTSFNLTSNNATLPILYYIYHKNIYTDFTNKVEFKKDREEIKRWLYSAILRHTFAGQSDTTLQDSRKAYTENINESYINCSSFSGKRIDDNLKNLQVIDDEFLDTILSTQKDNHYAFIILSLLYPYLDYKNNDFHKDHLHADSLYDELSDEIKKEYPYKVYNSILNLQMLDSRENESKGQTPLNIWVKNTCDSKDTMKRFLESHIIPTNVDLSLNNFPNFIKEREKLLKQELKKIFNGQEMETGEVTCTESQSKL